uniref:Acyl-CoA dehydrogenase n=1 Tax=Strombidinopsis acuminata TaxID=141414 RepID=A0A7S3WNT8_9SPIT
MKQTIGKELLLGQKWSALSITEPFVGSDVGSIKCTAEKTPDGKHYIVNGIKKWITEGAYADYFVTAVRTGAAGAKGISLLLVERGEGMTTSQIKTTYSTSAGTALVIMEDMKVPVENLLGKENEGFGLVMRNFNHERWLIVNNLLGQTRAAVADTFLWAKQRKVFGKALIEQPVIRNKLATAVAALESVQAYNEALTYDMIKDKDGPVGQRMAGPIAMLKYQTTRMAWNVADDTVQILGGRGITRTGMGAKIEGLKNYAKYAAVYGGSEEIMADLAIKQALKSFPGHAKL